jgi:2-polyprenyl-6-methoxyphenol hydroxylase-like FAD-dependent oxidoreductase
VRVVIIGAGVAGTALAVFLAEAGIACELYERAASSAGGAALAIASNGLAVLDAAGVLDTVDAATVRAGQWSFENQSGRLLAAVSDARRHTRWQTRMVSRPLLQGIMEDRLRALGIPIRFNKQCISVEDVAGQPIVVHFADGSRAEGDCVIGADGIGSCVRRAVWPESPAPRYTGMMAYVGFSPCAASAVVTAGAEQRVHMLFGRNAFFEYVDILTPAGPRTVWWSTAEAALPSRESLAASTIEDHRRELDVLHGDWAAPVRELFRTAEAIVPLPIHDLPELPTWSAGRSLILGDAAHPIGPHSGQASSMALEDAMLLGSLLAASRGAANCKGLTTVFHAFETARRERMVRVGTLGKRAEGRKQEMSRLRYWWLQQQMRIRVPIGACRPKGWLLDYRVEQPS